MSADLSDDGWERSSARAIARRLNRWQLLDIALVGRQGFMRITEQPPRHGTGQLIRDGVLKDGGRLAEGGRKLVPGPRFNAVKLAAQQREEDQLREPEMAQ